MDPISCRIASSGGGSRSAASVGFYRAMCELGIKVDIIIGTSVGAVNGAFNIPLDVAVGKGATRVYAMLCGRQEEMRMGPKTPCGC